MKSQRLGYVKLKIIRRENCQQINSIAKQLALQQRNYTKLF